MVPWEFLYLIGNLFQDVKVENCVLKIDFDVCVSEAGDRQLCIRSCTQNRVLMGAAIEGQNIALSGLYQYKICKF